MLLVSGEPHAGERTWRNLLKSDAAVDLVHFTILRPPEKQDGTPINELSLIAFPTRELFSEKIDQFDLIIFDRYQHRGVLPILYFDNIARYVRDGGARARRRRSRLRRRRQPLRHAAVAGPAGRRRPARSSRSPTTPRVTDVGERHPVTRDLDGSSFDPPHWGRWFRLIDVEKPRGRRRHEGRRGQAAPRPQPRRARAASRSSSPTTPGCGRAASRAAARMSTCCAAWRTG